MILPELLLLSLLSPLVEAFPNLYMSWWAPANGNVRRYVQVWPRRVAVVALVWGPLVAALVSIATTPGVVIGVVVLSAFTLRLVMFDRDLRRELRASTPPADVSVVPEIMYVAAFLGIGWVLWGAVHSMKWLVPVAIALIWAGASIIARFRRGPAVNPTWDRLGRAIFVVGFLLNLCNLHRALGGGAG